VVTIVVSRVAPPGAPENEIARGDERAADATADRRANLRVLEVQAGGVQFGPGPRQPWPCGSRLPRWEMAATASRSWARFASRSATSARAGGEIELRLVPARIDREEHITLRHELAGLKMDVLQVTGNAGRATPPSRWRRCGR